MANKNTIKAINKAKQVKKTDDFASYLNYVISGQVESKEHAETLSRTSKRNATLSDATILAQVVLKAAEQKITQLMERVQIQEMVLHKLGATTEMFEEAADEYDAKIAQMQEQLQKQAEELKEGLAEDVGE